MAAYDTVTAAVKGLQARGYTDEIDLAHNCLVCKGRRVEIDPADFHIDEFHRFEGDTDPGDECIVYAISAPEYGIKGILVNAYGPDAQPLAQELVAKLATH